MSSEDSNSMAVLPDRHDGRSDRPAGLIPDARGSDLSEEDEFSTDDFRMYKLKVFPCFAAYVHDWTRCPYYHPGENARRRDPSKCNYSPLQCPDHRLGLCRKGDACEFAHGLFETWLHPAQYRIKICREGALCTRNVCFFAHNALELRPIFAETGCAERRSPSELSPTASLFRPEHNRSPETSSYETSDTWKIYGSQRHASDSPLNQRSPSQSSSPAPSFNNILNPGFVSRQTRFTTEGWHDGLNSSTRSVKNDFGRQFLAPNRFRLQ